MSFLFFAQNKKNEWIRNERHKNRKKIIDINILYNLDVYGPLSRSVFKNDDKQVLSEDWKRFPNIFWYHF